MKIHPLYQKLDNYYLSKKNELMLTLRWIMLELLMMILKQQP